MSLYYLFGSLNGERCCIVGNCVLLGDVGEYKGFKTQADIWMLATSVNIL